MFQKDVKFQVKNILHGSRTTHGSCVLVLDFITFVHNNLLCVQYVLCLCGESEGY